MNLELLGWIVLHDQQTLAARTGILLDLPQRFHDLRGVVGFVTNEKRAARQSMMPVFIQGEHLHGDMARARILLQVVEHGPTQHVGEEDVERNGSGMIFAGQGEGLRAIIATRTLKPLSWQDRKDARIVRIVFDDQQHGIVGLQIRSIVGNLFKSSVH